MAGGLTITLRNYCDYAQFRHMPQNGQMQQWVVYIIIDIAMCTMTKQMPNMHWL